MKTLLELSAIRKSFGRAVILSGASLTVAEGQKIALIGRNGAGKSTLLNILLGMEEPDGGEVRRFSSLRLGAISQHEPLPSDVSGLEYLREKSGREAWHCAKLAANFGLHATQLAQPCASPLRRLSDAPAAGRPAAPGPESVGTG